MFRLALCALLVSSVFVWPLLGLADDEEPADDSTPPAAPELVKYDLKYKFTEGETVRSEVVHRATVQTTIQGTSQTAETQSKSIKCWHVEKIGDDGAVTFIHTVDSIDMWQKIQGRTEIRYNSQTDHEVPPGYEAVAEAVGVPLTLVTMDPRGRILRRFEKRGEPSSLSTQMTMPLPPEPVTVGQTWSSPLDIDVTLQDGSSKKVQTRQKFTLEKVVDDVATIGVDSQILTPINDPAIEAQLIQRLSAGSVRFDIPTGRVLSQQLDLDRHVIGFSGASSSMHYLTRFTERLLTASEQAALPPPRKPQTSAKAAPQTPSAKKPAPPRR